MFDKFFVGGDVLSSASNGKYKPVSRVTLLVDDENAITAGDDTGREIVANCPHATQEMVDALLASMKGYEYQAYEAGGANIDPAAELGDGVTVGGVYSVISRMRDDSSGYCDISAPGEEELEDEYPMEGPMTRMFNRQLAKTRSVIGKRIDELYLAVFGPEGSGEEASISVKLDQILQQVQGALGTDEEGNLIPVSSSIELALGRLTLEASDKDGTTTLTLKGGGGELSSSQFDFHVKAVNVHGKLTAEQIETKDLRVDAANITGKLTIGQLPEDDLVTAENVTEITSDAIKTASISANQITAGILNADVLTLDGLLYISRTDITGTASGYFGANPAKGAVVLASQNQNVGCLASDNAAKLSYMEEKMIWVAEGGCYANETMQVYSDRTLKNSISYDLSTEEKMFELLQPCSFAYISDSDEKKHWGFIAQDFVQSAEDVGFDPAALAVIGQYDGKYSLGYGEITALNTHMIQKLMRRVAALESRLEE